MTMHIDVDFEPSAGDWNAILRGLIAYNRQQEPRLHDLLHADVVAVIREDNGTIVAGGIGVIIFEMLYIDTLWTHPARRGRGYGTAILHAMESTAAAQGVHRAYLMTTSFQAKPFYEARGYDEWGSNRDRPRGHTMHYLRHDDLQRRAIAPNIEVQQSPDDDDVAMIERAFVSQTKVPLTFQPLGVFLRDAEGALQGGLVGKIWWDWYDVHLFWLADAVRGQGWGTKLLAVAEDACRQRECVGVVLDTMSWQALPFYQSQGYRIFGTLENRPFSHSNYFLEKYL